MKNSNSLRPNQESKPTIITIVMTALFIMAMTVEAILPDVRLRMAAMAVAALLLGSYLWLQGSGRNDKPIYESIVRQLLKAGYKCGVGNDNSICIQMEDGNLFARVWPMPKKKQKRVHFSALVEVDRNEISEDGLNYLATQFNAHHKYTTVLLRDEGLECRVETVVWKDSNVLGELSFAYKHIEQAAYTLMQNYPLVAKKYPAKPASKRRIGFVPSEAA